MTKVNKNNYCDIEVIRNILFVGTELDKPRINKLISLLNKKTDKRYNSYYKEKDANKALLKRKGRNY